MGIFAKPQETQTDNQFGVKVLFLHGLEGSPSGSKSQHMQSVWGALVPHLRTTSLVNLRDKCKGVWSTVDQEEIAESLEDVYNDAVDAIQYCKPDIVVGSSMGGALLYKMYADGLYTGLGVFLAPAISQLLSEEDIRKGHRVIKDTPTCWVLGETDTVVPNRPNVQMAKKCEGNLFFSPDDGHRLHKAVSSGLLDSAILTVIEMSETY